MEYLNKLLFKMQKNPDFNHHAKCERLSITNLAFADDVLLFARGDCGSIKLIMDSLDLFAKSTGLTMNPRKCKVFFGGVDANTRDMITTMTTFE